MSDDSTRDTVNSAAIIGVVYEMVQRVNSAINEFVENVYPETPMEELESEKAFVFGFAIAKGIFSATGVARLLLIICPESKEYKWKRKLSEALDAVHATYRESPIELVEEQLDKMRHLEEVLAEMMEKVRQQVLASDLGSGDFFSDEYLQGLLKSAPKKDFPES